MSGYIGPKSADVPVGTIATKGTLSGNSLLIGTNNATIGNSVYVVANGRIGIGTSSFPTNINSVNPKLVSSDYGVNSAIQIIRHTQVGAGGGIIQLSSTRGTSSVDYTAIANNDGIGSLIFAGADGNTFATAASIVSVADATPSVGSMPSRMVFNTSASGSTSPTERMRIDSAGNIGIGGAPYNYGGGYTGFWIQGSTGGVIDLSTGGTRVGTFLNTSTDVTIGSISTVPFIFKTSNVERMRIDAAGNLGLGVAPSDWGSGVVGFNFGTRASLATNNLNNVLGVNAVWANSAWRYITSSVAASQYVQWGAEHQWFVAPTGTAGANITFTQAMTLAANGNLGVGTSTPVSKFELLTSTATSYVTTESGQYGYSAYPHELSIRNTAVNTAYSFASIYFQGGQTTAGTGINAGRIALVRDNNNSYGGSFTFSTRDSGGNFGERMRVDVSGNIGIGYTSPASRLHVANEIRIGRTDASSEGGEIKLCRSIDDAAAYSIDVYGSTTNPELRMFNSIGGTVFFSSANSGVNYIKFNPTQNAIGDANALDDYEEGTWTPAWGSSGTLSSVSYATQLGRYIKIGRVVHFWGRIYMNGWATGGSGNIRVTGLPFASSNEGAGLSLCHVTFTYSGGNATWPAGATQVFGQIQQGTTYFEYLSLGVPTNALGENGKLQWTSNPAMFNNYFSGTYITEN